MTNLHEAPDVSATLSETDLSIRRFRGASYEEALTAAQAELGDNIRVIGADRIRRGGLGGFFATDLGVEVAVAPVVSDSRTTAKSLAWGTDDSPGDLADQADQAVSDLDWDELMRRVEADDQRNNRRATRRVGVEQLLDDAERSDRSLSSWAREDESDLDVPDFVKPLLLEPEQSDSADPVYGDSFFGIDIEPEIEALVVDEFDDELDDELEDELDDELEIVDEFDALVVDELDDAVDDAVDDDWFEGIDMAPDALADNDWFQQFVDQGDVSVHPSCEPAPVERASRRGPRIVDGGDGGARLLDDVLAVSESPTEEVQQSTPVVEIAPIVEAAAVLPSVVVLADLVAAQPDTVFGAIADYEPVGSPLPAPAPSAPAPSAPAPSAPALPAPSLPSLPAPVALVQATVPVATVADDRALDDAATIIEVIAPDNTMAMPEVTLVEATELSLSDPLRRPTELATIAVGRLAMRLAELPPFNGGLLPDAYRVHVAVTTPDGTRIEMSTEVDGTGD